MGHYDDKALRAEPKKTFVPRELTETAHDRKLNFLSSDILPRADTTPNPVVKTRGSPQLGEIVLQYNGEEPEVDHIMRRQTELSSDLNGRKTPAVAPHDAHDMSRKLTPSCYNWQDLPEALHRPTAEWDCHARAYEEKCSSVLNPSPRQEYVASLDTDKRQREIDDAEEESKRRQHHLYSNVLGKEAAIHSPSGSIRRPKYARADEDKITIFGDWTNAKTELACGSTPVNSSASERKQRQLHQSNIFNGEVEERVKADQTEPFVTNNSMKTTNAFGLHTQQVHQAHLQSSLVGPDFYETAYNSRAWEVISLHISGLPPDATEHGLRHLCKGFDLQIVKVAVELDPARNVCKGRARIMVRYNPEFDQLLDLVRKLEAAKLDVSW
jgi:hypothetical protein